ncbi:MAG TPA: 23S rRNA (adenine(2503)-C(2))-methyltransferase RlmN [Ruminiclostridium sp.]|nr:23S rRNA (adenine(2503)-C(2))-methyltransferase RlmN [Ruminiclostridium sp.]
MGDKTDIKSLTPKELEIFLKEMGEPSFRARQIFSWLHKGVCGFDEMTDLSLKLRDKLAEKSEIVCPNIKKRLVSELDDTIKYLYEFSDGESVESVLMSYHHGNTVCISTQAGCRMNCAFCASSLKGLSRNLAPSEMLSQVLTTQKDSGRRISNVVLMGIGEPLDNYDNVLKFLHILSAPGGINIGQRHISLSTCGVVDRIYDLMREKLQITLSVSLHAPNDEIRSRIMPINKRWNVDDLLKACRDYIDATKRRISFEYALISGVNDSPESARELGAKLRGMLCHVNLIPANEVKERGLKKSSSANVARFYDILSEYGLTVTIRRTLGSDINASCGQLRFKHGAGQGGN